LFGGWAIDFLLGHFTRPHVDIDAIIWQSDEAVVATLMESLGYQAKQKPGRLQCEKEEGYRIDFYIQPHNPENFLPSKPWPDQDYTVPLTRYTHAVTTNLHGVQIKVIDPLDYENWLKSKILHNAQSGEGASGPSSKNQLDLKNLQKYSQ
jgi:hypothetical protein